MGTNKCHYCGQELPTPKKFAECGKCGNNTFEHVSVEDAKKLTPFGTLHWYRCKKCGEISWCSFWELSEDGERLIKRFDSHGQLKKKTKSKSVKEE